MVQQCLTSRHKELPWEQDLFLHGQNCIAKQSSIRFKEHRCKCNIIKNILDLAMGYMFLIDVDIEKSRIRFEFVISELILDLLLYSYENIFLLQLLING